MTLKANHLLPGAILGETLAQVERWRQMPGGLREVESADGSRTADERATFAPDAFIQA